MVYPDNGSFNDRAESTVAENSSPLVSDLMVDPASNEIYRLAQSSQNDDISFLPSDNMLLSDLEDSHISSYSSGADEITIDPADQVSYGQPEQVSSVDQAQVSYGDQDQVSYGTQEQVSYGDQEQVSYGDAEQVSYAEPEQVSSGTQEQVSYAEPEQVSSGTQDQVSYAEPEPISSGHQDLVSVNETPNDVQVDATSQATDASLYQFADASIRAARQYPRSEQNNLTIGTLEHGYDENNNHISISGPGGEYFYKGSDGKWVEHMPPSGERTVENLKFDNDGNMEFDVVGEGTVAHHKRNADGSHSIDSPEHGGLLAYDKDGNLIQAPAGDGQVRKFHYTNGQLDQVDGRLGHWDRVEKDGKVSWKNRDTGAVWDGDMKVNPKTNELEFRGRNGVAWNFTTTGKDVYAGAR